MGIAIIVIGPKDFPYVLKKIGSWIGNLKRTINNFQNQISEIDEDIVQDQTKSEKKDNDKK